MLIWEPNPAARCSAYRTGYSPPIARLSGPSDGSTSLKFGDGRDDPGLERLDGQHVLDADAHGCARSEPLGVGDDHLVGAAAPNTARRAVISAWALPPRAGV